MHRTEYIVEKITAETQIDGTAVIPATGCRRRRAMQFWKESLPCLLI